MEKKLVSLTEDQMSYLETEARKQGVSESELLRRIITMSATKPPRVANIAELQPNIPFTGITIKDSDWLENVVAVVVQTKTGVGFHNGPVDDHAEQLEASTCQDLRRQLPVLYGGGALPKNVETALEAFECLYEKAPPNAQRLQAIHDSIPFWYRDHYSMWEHNYLADALKFLYAQAIANFPKQETPLNVVPQKVSFDMDILEFAKSQNIFLFPVQQFILKAFYGIPFDDVNAVCPLSNNAYAGDTTTHLVTEAKYCKALYEQGRCNIQESKVGMREAVLALGRRSGKSLLLSLIAAYETRKLLAKENPQGYYGLPSSNTIQILTVCANKEQAGLQYKETLQMLPADSSNNTQSFVMYPKHIKVVYRSAVARGLCGSTNHTVLLDEAAHFFFCTEVYDAVVPSVSAFSPKDGRIVLASTPYPLAKDQRFRKLFQVGMSQEDALLHTGMEIDCTMLCLQIPTWEANPNIPQEAYKNQQKLNPHAFGVEFGACWE